MANTWFNIFFSILFLILSITMLGFGNLSRLQSVGISFGNAKSSRLRAFGMGAGAGLVAAPCTGPILAGLIAYTATLNNEAATLGLFLLYSSGFALPYLLLGFASGRVRSFKVNSQLQILMKVFFSAMMFGLALYYLKNPLHGLIASLQGNWRTIFIVLIVGCAILLFMLLRTRALLNNQKIIVIPALLLGVCLFSGIQFVFGGDHSSSLSWHNDEQAAYNDAKRSGKPILVDGWADWCPACKKMDVTTFADAEVISLLERDWTLLKLDLTQQNDRDTKFVAKYRMPGLPTIVLVPADGDLTKSVTLSGYVSKDTMLHELRAFKLR